MDGIKQKINIGEPVKSQVPVHRGVTLEQASKAIEASEKTIAETPKKETVQLAVTSKSKIPATMFNKSSAEAVVKETAKLTVGGVTKKIVGSGLIGIPFDAATEIFSYHNKKINSSQFAAKAANGFFSWSAFEAGQLGATAIASAVIGRKIGPLGGMVVGVGVGMVASSLYNKTIGLKVEEKISKAIPESISKPVADKMDKYFATPIDKYVLTPIKEHPKTSIAVGAGIVAALSIKYPVAFGKNMVLGTIGANIIGRGGNMLLDKIIKPHQENSAPKEASGQVDKPAVKKADLPPLNQPVTQAELDWALPLEEKFSKDKNSVSDADAIKYLNILQRYENMQKAEK